MTQFGRYRLALLLSVFAFLGLYSIYLSLPEVKKKLKSPQNSVIKVALIIPVKPLPKPIQKVVVPPTPIIEKPIIKKVVTPKPKKIIKKIKPKPKKIIRKPKKIIKKTKPKKIVKKKVIKKVIHKKVITPRAIVREVVPQRVPIVTPPPTNYSKPKPIAKQITRPTPITKHIDNGQNKKRFLHAIRQKIVANKKYPKLALRRHIEGDTKVRFDITASGEVTNIRFISGKTLFHKSIRKTLQRTFPVNIPTNMQGKLPIYDVSVTLHFNIR